MASRTALTAMTTPKSLDWLAPSLEDLERQGLRRWRRVGAGIEGPVVDFGSNDYLGLAGDPRLAEAAADAARQEGWGAGASPVVSGRSPRHRELEERLAEFERTKAALVFNTGFAANAGVIPSLVESGDVLYADAKNHASLIDGCRLSNANRHIYPHNDLDTLAEMLERDSGCYRRRLILTDGLFSMDGDFAPLGELGELAEQHDAILVIDEAHATGVWGPGGRGSVERAAVESPRLESQVAVRIGTLSKAFGSTGGFVAGSRQLIDWLYNRARPYVFSTAPPAATAAASLAALEIAQSEPDRRQRCVANATKLRQRLAAAGWNCGESTSQIVPIFLGDPERAVALGSQLARAGLFVPAIRPPSVPEGESLLRVSVSARHSDTELDRLVGALGEPGESMRSE